jgi:hypothetical protein
LREREGESREEGSGIGSGEDIHGKIDIPVKVRMVEKQERNAKPGGLS